MGMLLANDRDGDPAHPERYPDRYVPISCAQCTRCWLDRLAGKCLSGGPFNPNLEYAFTHCRDLRNS